jgi:hypothetical protein
MRSRLDKDRVGDAEQLRLPMLPITHPALKEAARRGLAVEASAYDVDRRLVGEIGGLIAGLNRAMDEAAIAGIDVVVTAHYQDAVPPAPGSGSGASRKRCVLAGMMRRLALTRGYDSTGTHPQGASPPGEDAFH